ncbi:hypothetical protein [Mesorhizobium comanense]|uniref:hypothetical protein n=1 Tax=Mesorhizobium comanense TaxID=2502215 RepID=UPI0010F8F9CA|nr:hypothetical protein [Mesorhizobium comanense]
MAASAKSPHAQSHIARLHLQISLPIAVLPRQPFIFLNAQCASGGRLSGALLVLLSCGSEAIVRLGSHCLPETGALPTGITAGRNYFIPVAGLSGKIMPKGSDNDRGLKRWRREWDSNPR